VGTGNGCSVDPEANAGGEEPTLDGSADRPCDWEKSRSHPQ
jgi:hypothetical protein